MSEGLLDGENVSRTGIEEEWDSSEAPCCASEHRFQLHQSQALSSRPQTVPITNHKLSPEMHQGSPFSTGLDEISHGVVRVQ